MFSGGSCSSSSSSSSSPLLSLVQVPAKLAINLSIHTQHTYDNGVDRTGDRVFWKIQLLHEEREEEKKILTPRLCSIWSTVWEQKKNTSAQKHIYHKHMTCNRGNISSSGKQPSGPVPFVSAPVNRPARPSGGAKRYRGSWMGEGSNVCSRGEGGRDSHSIVLTGWLSRRPWPRRRYGEPEKIRLNCCDTEDWSNENSAVSFRKCFEHFWGKNQYIFRNFCKVSRHSLEHVYLFATLLAIVMKWDHNLADQSSLEVYIVFPAQSLPFIFNKDERHSLKQQQLQQCWINTCIFVQNICVTCKLWTFKNMWWCLCKGKTKECQIE